MLTTRVPQKKRARNGDRHRHKAFVAGSSRAMNQAPSSALPQALTDVYDGRATYSQTPFERVSKDGYAFAGLIEYEVIFPLPSPPFPRHNFGMCSLAHNLPMHLHALQLADFLESEPTE